MLLMDGQSSLPGPSLLVVSDLGDMFVPLTDGFLVDPTESRYVVIFIHFLCVLSPS